MAFLPIDSGLKINPATIFTQTDQLGESGVVNFAGEFDLGNQMSRLNDFQAGLVRRST